MGVISLRINSKDVMLSSVFASLYVVINILQMFSPAGNPSVFGPIQLRLADFLIALSALFGKPVAVGVTVGCVIVNAFGPIGAIDIVFGSLANFLAAYSIIVLRKHCLTAYAVGSLIIAAIVGGGYLWLFFEPPSILIFMPAPLAMFISIFLSSLIAIAGLGYIIVRFLSKPSIINSLRAYGLKIFE